jgi:lipopolysaccharide transport system ATP-binding protein
MSDIVIKAENLGKSYIIGHEKRERYTALRNVLANKVRQIAGKTCQIFKGGQPIAGQEMEEF